MLLVLFGIMEVRISQEDKVTSFTSKDTTEKSLHTQTHNGLYNIHEASEANKTTGSQAAQEDHDITM